uniref:alpha-1,2-Mannosidase n=1 Tax=Ascaris lumbricoides TaxID=6252 RepID=A0A9J2PH42_ASCLU
MPLSCRGRARGVTPSRGDIDDSLGNFSLTLVDTLDTLVVVGELNEFERAVRLVVSNVRFDSDFVVSVFETNIRMLGGLLSGHVLAKLVQSKEEGRLGWYTNELLDMAVNLADRLLPAFNTTSGLPYSRGYLREQRDTCTACGGTLLLEFAALSRLSGKPIYEEKARKAMDFLWAQRNRGSDLMGTVLNVHSGDWVRRDAGIGAGIDSYYEYCLKAYILLGDDDYLHRFNKHYDAIMRYVNKGPVFIDVHMHKPSVASRSFMDALLAFWPGLQVLKGDLKSAIEFHETLYQVVKKHRFLPEAFTHDLQVHWAQHPLRPEFIESTYLLYRATKDPHYLHVAKNVMDSLNELVRVKCGFAGVRDIRTMSHEDRMDSFVLSETFKYLYMIFSEPSEMLFDPDNYVLTTEAHFLPLTIGDAASGEQPPRRILIDPDELIEERGTDQGSKKYRSACPSSAHYASSKQLSSYAHALRSNVRTIMAQVAKHSAGSSPSDICPQPSERLRAWSFSSSNSEHVHQLNQMGIQVQMQPNGHLQLVHSTAEGGADMSTDERVALQCALEAIQADANAAMGRELYAHSSSHAIASQMLSIIMLIVFLWLALVLSSACIICFTALMYRIFFKNRCDNEGDESLQVQQTGSNNEHKVKDTDDGNEAAISPQWASLGMEFMNEMMQMMAQLERQELGIPKRERVVQVLSEPSFGFVHFIASPAHFGADLHNKQVEGEVHFAMPSKGCVPLTNAPSIANRIAVVHRHDYDMIGSSAEGSPPFAMSGDNSVEDDIRIPVVFLFHKEGVALLEHLRRFPTSLVRISDRIANPSILIEGFFKHHEFALPHSRPWMHHIELLDVSDHIMVVDTSIPAVLFNFRFGDVQADSDSSLKHRIVEKNIAAMGRIYGLPSPTEALAFYNVVRRVAYSQLGIDTKPTHTELARFALQLSSLSVIGDITSHSDLPAGRSDFKFAANSWKRQMGRSTRKEVKRESGEQNGNGETHSSFGRKGSKIFILIWDAPYTHMANIFQVTENATREQNGNGEAHSSFGRKGSKIFILIWDAPYTHMANIFQVTENATMNGDLSINVEAEHESESEPEMVMIAGGENVSEASDGDTESSSLQSEHIEESSNMRKFAILIASTLASVPEGCGPCRLRSLLMAVKRKQQRLLEMRKPENQATFIEGKRRILGILLDLDAFEEAVPFSGVQNEYLKKYEEQSRLFRNKSALKNIRNVFYKEVDVIGCNPLFVKLKTRNIELPNELSEEDKRRAVGIGDVEVPSFNEQYSEISRERTISQDDPSTASSTVATKEDMRIKRAAQRSREPTMKWDEDEGSDSSVEDNQAGKTSTHATKEEAVGSGVHTSARTSHAPDVHNTEWGGDSAKYTGDEESDDSSSPELNDSGKSREKVAAPHRSRRNFIEKDNHAPRKSSDGMLLVTDGGADTNQGLLRGVTSEESGELGEHRRATRSKSSRRQTTTERSLKKSIEKSEADWRRLQGAPTPIPVSLIHWQIFAVVGII